MNDPTASNRARIAGSVLHMREQLHGARNEMLASHRLVREEMMQVREDLEFWQDRPGPQHMQLSARDVTLSRIERLQSRMGDDLSTIERQLEALAEMAPFLDQRLHQVEPADQQRVSAMLSDARALLAERFANAVDGSRLTLADADGLSSARLRDMVQEPMQRAQMQLCEAEKAAELFASLIEPQMAELGIAFSLQATATCAPLAPIGALEALRPPMQGRKEGLAAQRQLGL